MEKSKASINSIYVYTTCAVVIPIANPPEACPFCDSVLTLAKGSLDPLPASLPISHSASQNYLQLCESCGWWLLSARFKFRMGDDDTPGERYSTENGAAFAVFHRFPLGGIDSPVAALKARFPPRYVDRFSIDPRKLGDLITSIFRDFGYSVELKSYSKDGGIILILLNTGDGVQKVVQVAHNKKPIEITDVDAFLGPMVQHRHYQGIYVTTSEFIKGWRYLYRSHTLSELGYSVELVDAASLFDALKASLPGGSSNSSKLYENAWNLRNKMPRWLSPAGWQFDIYQDKHAQQWVESVERGGESEE